MKTFTKNKDIELFKREHDGVCYVEEVPIVWNASIPRGTVEVQCCFYFGTRCSVEMGTNIEEEPASFVHTLITGCFHYSTEY